MPVSVRLRGAVWHARGTVRIGRQSVRIAEFSTGCHNRSDAIAVAEAEAARIRGDALAGPAARADRLTIDDCLAVYITRAKRPKPYDLTRVRVLSDAIGTIPLASAAEAWGQFAARRPNNRPSTLARWRTILVAAIAAGCEARGMPPPRVPAVAQPRGERVVYLTDDERRRLLAAYSPDAACPVLLLAYQGLRTQEALRLDWRHVSIERSTITVMGERSKSGRGRTLPMHPRVKLLLVGMWEAAGRPQLGAVFLSRRGRPYADTRLGARGGNPLSKAHDTACRLAEIEHFRVHDWRHDWAARMVMGGVDMYALMQLGGWSTLRMVERYASVSAEHLRAAVAKLA